MATLSFELVSPERVLFSGDVDAVVLPASCRGGRDRAAA